METPRTPFPATGYYGPKYFCDRKEELDQLTKNIKGGNSTTLVALRRLGKTALIKHLFYHLRSKYLTIYMDILPTESLNNMLNRLSTAIVSGHPEKSAFGKKVWNVIRSLRPVISYDALSGLPQVSIKATPDESRSSIEELLAFLEKQPKPVVIALDEFQQILEYPEKQTDAWLRSIVQNLNNVSFIFSGSQQHLVADMFANPERPFFRSTQFMKIGKLDEGTYRDFIIEKFKEHSKDISGEVVTEILRWTDLYTYYAQLLCNRIFLSGGKLITSETWKDEAAKILKEQEFVFFGYREMLTKPQWALLKAIASEGKVFQPTSYDFISEHSLGNPATVLRSLKSLMGKEMIYREKDAEGNSYYGIYDVLFGRWVGRKRD
ncbi:MAG: ATP-binding protein [Bacteroidales bacterium]|nr:ATP-binding protein [Bacteroidales bacterium]